MAIRQWHRVIHVNEFVRYKQIYSAQEVSTFAPEQAQKWMKTGIGAAWKLVRFPLRCIDSEGPRKRLNAMVR